MRMKFTQAARKHKIAKGRALHVIRNTEPVEVTDDNGNVTGFDWIGNDDRGLELHIIGIVKVDERSATGEKIALITHVFPTALNKKGE